MKQKEILIYGISGQAQQLKYYIESENKCNIAGFVVDKDYKTHDELLGSPVYEFETIKECCSPGKYTIALSFGYKNMVRNRQNKFELCKAKGYDVYTFISKRANVYTQEIGEGTIIYPGVTVAPFTVLGKGNFLEIGVSIAHHSKMGDFNFFAPGATICGGCEIENNCFIGAGATVIHSRKVSDLTLVAAGAVLSRDSKVNDVCFAPHSTIVENKSTEIEV